MQHKLVRFFVFLVVNFSALALGSYLMNNGPRSQWYLSLDKAPWTPPGFMFGLAWSIIMICFAFYMNKLSFTLPYLNKKLIAIFSVQWLLNVGWNFTFFNQQQFKVGLFILIFLWMLLLYFTKTYQNKLQKHTFYIIPYLLWMTIAISLNAYIVIMN